MLMSQAISSFSQQQTADPAVCSTASQSPAFLAFADDQSPADLATIEQTGLSRAGSRDGTYRRFLAVADATAAAGAALVAVVVAGSGRFSVVMMFAAVPLIVIISRMIGTYNRVGLLVHKSTLDEAPA